MGFFSWETSDTNKSIPNIYSSRETFPVYLLLPDGGLIKETTYEGYGIFGGKDVYALVANWNVPDLCNGNESHDRNIGIDIACAAKQNANLQYPIKFVEDPKLKYKNIAPSKGCKYQGYFYD